ncbi:hypothetical protein F0562_031481 [Nyssa sinensis]|uniref:WRKY domain-containing protein n=1 Tax=Nyssa sinensis TaxID=561372 RepID=A0A5J5AUK1_9ASTE|nr:hypothetical protein F0562_031481 [Nyssa sinensis]
MDESIFDILNGCKLARELESNLPNLANQRNVLINSCDEIISMFRNARDRLNADQDPTTNESPQPGQIGAGGAQEWLLRFGFTQAVDLLNAQFMAGKRASGVPENKMDGTRWQQSTTGLEVLLPFDHEMGGRDAAEGSTRLRSSGVLFQPLDVSDSGGGSSSQRSRRRDDPTKRTVRLPAPQTGNTENPPEDGYAWRKYGQKEILGSRYPRGYYRCTHQKLYQCPAKKQVQKLDNDPYTFEVTYRGNHTCHMSSTAPSFPPPSTDQITQETMTPETISHPPPPPASNPLRTWLSMDIKPTGEGTSSAFIFGPGGAGTSGSNSGGAGPSTVRYGREDDYGQPVVDLADAMFNSGSSSSNSMDIIFSVMEDKWEAEDKKD